MPGQRFSPFGRGEKLRASDLNRLGVEQVRQSKITGDGNIIVTDGPHGVTLALRPDEMMAIVTGDGPPYTVQEAQVEPDGMFFVMDGGRQGAGYEINGFPVVPNSVVRAWPGRADNEWHFAYFGASSGSGGSVGGDSSIDCGGGSCVYSASSGQWKLVYTTCAHGCLCGAAPVCPPGSGCARVVVPCVNPDAGIPSYAATCTSPSSAGSEDSGWPSIGWCYWDGSHYIIAYGPTPPTGASSVFGACESSISSCCCSDNSGCLGECEGNCWYKNGSLFSKTCESACGCHATAPVPPGYGSCDVYADLCRRSLAPPASSSTGGGGSSSTSVSSSSSSSGATWYCAGQGSCGDAQCFATVSPASSNGYILYGTYADEFQCSSACGEAMLHYWCVACTNQFGQTNFNCQREMTAGCAAAKCFTPEYGVTVTGPFADSLTCAIACHQSSTSGGGGSSNSSGTGGGSSNSSSTATSSSSVSHSSSSSANSSSSTSRSSSSSSTSNSNSATSVSGTPNSSASGGSSGSPSSTSNSSSSGTGTSNSSGTGTSSGVGTSSSGIGTDPGGSGTSASSIGTDPSDIGGGHASSGRGGFGIAPGFVMMADGGWVPEDDSTTSTATTAPVPRTTYTLVTVHPDGTRSSSEVPLPTPVVEQPVEKEQSTTTRSLRPVQKRGDCGCGKKNRPLM